MRTPPNVVIERMYTADTLGIRGEADKRQVAGAKVALQHNIGPGGAAVVTVYRGVG